MNYVSFGLRPQPVNATHSLNFSAGVANFSVFLGLSLSCRGLEVLNQLFLKHTTGLDRLFETYRATPVEGHDGMTVGIEDFRTASDLRLYKMLLQPFRKQNNDE